MSERNRPRWMNKWACLAATLTVAVVASGFVFADPQTQKKGTAGGPQTTKAAASKSTSPESAKKPDTSGAAALAKEGGVGPVVAVVNGDEITYKALAEECIARKGAEILETMISRHLVDQACRERGVKITGQEIDEEIRRTADRMQMSPEQYLKMLKENREITYEQYVRDVVLPSLSLKKMAKPFVKVTEEDIEKGYEAFFGEKMQCRWIMLNDLQAAMKVWDELKKSDTEEDGKINLGEFEYQVNRWSVDQNSRSLGGQLQAISRHTSPTFKAIEDAAFSLKEDGEISKVVQFGQAWVILYRENKVPAAAKSLEEVRSDLERQLYEIKMKDQIEQIFVSMQRTATIENRLTGQVISPDKKTVTAEHIEKVSQEPAKTGNKGETPKKNTTPSKK
ncbi:MAG TPA: peptidyl-prolyl cis-trans isomerase [Aestuariivirgaceae bacterium]|nr:peptidyl-prolyl cis-trans isomerase [Aestuariivirgaceae bacterium]